MASDGRQMQLLKFPRMKILSYLGTMWEGRTENALMKSLLGLCLVACSSPVGCRRLKLSMKFRFCHAVLHSPFNQVCCDDKLEELL